MITLITGMPGAGKTLRMVETMAREVAKGRAVLTNIDGITLPGVMQLPADWDGHWQEFDDGTVLCLDEVQTIWRSTGKPGQTTNADVMALETHRHRGFDFYLTTQHPTFVENHVRKLVGKHEHINRPKGSKHVGISSKDHYFDIHNELHSADFNMWTHPKEYFEYYNSASHHTHEFKLPRKVMFALAAIVFLTVGGLYGLSQSILFGLDEPETIAQTNPVHKAVMTYDQQDWADVATKTTVAGCISSESKCQCYSPSGQPLQIPPSDCFRHVENPLPFTVITGSGSERQPRHAGGTSPLPLI